jgi:hypothetical protein
MLENKGAERTAQNDLAVLDGQPGHAFRTGGHWEHCPYGILGLRRHDPADPAQAEGGSRIFFGEGKGLGECRPVVGHAVRLAAKIFNRVHLCVQERCGTQQGCKEEGLEHKSEPERNHPAGSMCTSEDILLRKTTNS